MTRAEVWSDVETEVERIRELSRRGQHREALAAAEVLAEVAPAHRDVLYLRAVNQRCLGRVREAVATLQRLEQQHPRFSLLYQERGYCFLTLQDAPQAMQAFQRAVEINAALVSSWGVLERLYGMAGDVKRAQVAAEQVSSLNRLPPEIMKAGSLFSDGALPAAENILRAYLREGTTHMEAMRLLARIDQQQNVLDEAETLLESVLKLAPDYRAARTDYVRVLVERQKYPQASEEVRRLLSLDSKDEEYLSLYAAACAGLGEHETAVTVYRELIASWPERFELHVALGNCLKALGRQKEATESYRMAAVARPGFGDAYWSLANLKTYRFSPDEIARMRSEETAPRIDAVDRYHLCFALGKALEDRGEYAESWNFYARGNALKRARSRYSAEIAETNTRQQIEVCTPQFFAERAGFGIVNADPIFIVGLPRSGSTLIEQILASHSQVEGTQELADIQRCVSGLQGYPAVLTKLAPEDFRRLGEQYIADTRAYRRSEKPLFIDKMPNNFRHIGLIHLLLPNARIIDVRREPMACCFSNFKQLFASGQEFTYGVEEIARYYRTYIDLMRHWDVVLPGRVLRVFHEDVVDDLEGNVRRILAFCGLEFEAACVEFHKTERSVRTASSEQVRQPIFREGLSQWRNYEHWLGGLKDSLGDALIRYRE